MKLLGRVTSVISASKQNNKIAKYKIEPKPLKISPMLA